LQNSKEVIVSIQFKVKKQINALQLFVDLVDQYDKIIFRAFHYEVDGAIGPSVVAPGNYFSQVVIPKNVLVEGNYRFIIQAANMYERMIEPKEGISFKVTIEETGRYSRKIYGSHKGLVTINALWETKLVD
jgi:hypothetical protein